MATEFRTADIDEFRGQVERAMGRPLAVAAVRGRYDARLRQDVLGRLSFTNLEYGNNVELFVEGAPYYVFQAPLGGVFFSRTVGPERAYSPAVGQLIMPNAPMRLRWPRESGPILVMHFDRTVVDEAASALAGGRPAPLPEVVPLGGSALWRWVRFLWAESQRADGVGSRQAEQTLLELLLGGAAEPGTKDRAVPYYVRRAEAFLEGNLERDVGMIDLVQAVGVSARTLYDGFRRARGLGPMGWLRRLRLERVRAELATAPPETLVTDVAIRWGFVHLGRFAAAYQQAFGERPSQTLRRR